MSSDGSPSRPVSRTATIATSNTAAPASRIRSSSATSTWGPLPHQVPRDENPDASHSIRVFGRTSPRRTNGGGGGNRRQLLPNPTALDMRRMVPHFVRNHPTHGGGGGI